MKHLVHILSLILLVKIKGFGSVLPPNMPSCKRNDPRISDCIARAVEALRPRLASGDFGGGYRVQPLEPFMINELTFGNDKLLKINLFNVIVNGIPQFKIDKLRVNVNDIKVDVLAFLPKLDIRAKYKMNIHLLGQPLQSSGDYITQYVGAKIKIQIKAQTYTKNGATYARFEPFNIKFDRGSTSFLKITNLFEGNKVLNEIAYSVVRNNEDALLKSLYPQIEASLSKSFTDTGNKIIENASYDEIFPL